MLLVNRQAELDSLRAGKVKHSGRLGGLGGSSRLAGSSSRLMGLSGSSSRLAGSDSRLAGDGSRRAGGKRGGLDLKPVRRSGRNADKRVRCAGAAVRPLYALHCHSSVTLASYCRQR